MTLPGVTITGPYSTSRVAETAGEKLPGVSANAVEARRAAAKMKERMILVKGR